MVIFKRMVNCLLAMIVLALAMPLANAGNPQGRGQRQQQSRDQRETTQSFSHTDRDGEGKRSQRLSPEERRQLRRDIKEAGREIFTAPIAYLRNRVDTNASRTWQVNFLGVASKGRMKSHGKYFARNSGKVPELAKVGKMGSERTEYLLSYREAENCLE